MKINNTLSKLIIHKTSWYFSTFLSESFYFCIQVVIVLKLNASYSNLHLPELNIDIDIESLLKMAESGGLEMARELR